MLRAARVGVEVPGDVTIRVRESGGEGGGGFHGNGISKAVVDVAGPELMNKNVNKAVSSRGFDIGKPALRSVTWT